MKTLAVQRRAATAEALTGRVLCHDVRDGLGRIAGRKGEVVNDATAAKLLALEWEELHLLELEPGDLHEEEAGRRLSAAVIGLGVTVRGYAGGQWSLVAAHRGLLRVREEALCQVNTLPGISVFTLFHDQPVEAGEVVAKAKVTPLALASSVVEQVERQARAAGGLVTVAPFRARVLGAVARESLEEGQRRRFEAALTEKISWLGATLLPVRFATGAPRAVVEDLQALRHAGADLLIVAGASALDPLDPVFGALELLGARMARHGAPAHPGSLLWLAHWDGLALVGMPTCGMFSQATTFDLVLPRLLVGDLIGNAEIAALGHGGLLSRETAYRFPPYRPAKPRGELDAEE
jgi:hypothetical protein